MTNLILVYRSHIEGEELIWPLDEQDRLVEAVRAALREGSSVQIYPETMEHAEFEALEESEA